MKKNQSAAVVVIATSLLSYVVVSMGACTSTFSSSTDDAGASGAAGVAGGRGGDAGTDAGGAQGKAGTDSVGGGDNAGGANPEGGGAAGMSGAAGNAGAAGAEPIECSDGDERPCTEGGLFGACAEGTQACADGEWQACSIEPASEDTCEPGNDANCNGTGNEGCGCLEGSTQSCQEHPGLDGNGPCKPGEQTCVVGVDKRTSWGACIGSIGPAASDSCTAGDDSDCDGQPNEGCTCINGATRDCGHCGDGTETCSNGSWGSCIGATPQNQCCSGKFRCRQDNDSDTACVGAASNCTTSCALVGEDHIRENSCQSQDDCYDNDDRVHPGQDEYFATAGPNGWDYNCSGRVETSPSSLEDHICSFAPACNSNQDCLDEIVVHTFDESDCGSSRMYGTLCDCDVDGNYCLVGSSVQDISCH